MSDDAINQQNVSETMPLSEPADVVDFFELLNGSSLGSAKVRADRAVGQGRDATEVRDPRLVEAEMIAAGRFAARGDQEAATLAYRNVLAARPTEDIWEAQCSAAACLPADEHIRWLVDRVEEGVLQAAPTRLREVARGHFQLHGMHAVGESSTHQARGLVGEDPPEGNGASSQDLLDDMLFAAMERWVGGRTAYDVLGRAVSRRILSEEWACWYRRFQQERQRQVTHQPSYSGPRRVDRGAGRRKRWETRFAALVIGSDVVSILTMALLGNVLGFAPGAGILAGIFMVLGLVLCRAWDARVLGQGVEEFNRLSRGVTTSAVALGLLGLVGQTLSVRPWVFGLMPIGAVLAVGGRLVLRRRLQQIRAAGRCVLPVLAVGTPESVADLITRTRRDHRTGWSIAGVCTPSGTAGDDGYEVLGVPVIGDLESVPVIAETGRYRIVAVCPTPALTPLRLHHLVWGLENTAVELVTDPSLVEVAGPRLHVEPVDGLPLLRLTRPTFTGVAWILKTVVDKLGAMLGLLMFAPLLLVIAVLVKLDGGPVLFRQTRVGRHGDEFIMLKFRSMVVDAQKRRAELDQQNEGAGPLFKMRNDPRVTRVGAVLRRYSLDELPQLFNVLAGTMSLVGPRPPLPREVATYSRDAQRRLMVRPGMTGLWQVSGRSDMSWEQAVRLDLRYVENWNLALDGVILWKTVGALVAGGHGGTNCHLTGERGGVGVDELVTPGWRSTVGDHLTTIGGADPITLVVTAVVLGASAGVKDTAASTVKDTYTGLKGLLARRRVDVSGVERRPDSGTQRAALAETLSDTPDAVDEQVLVAARAVTEAVATHDADAAGVVVGVRWPLLSVQTTASLTVQMSGT